MQKWNEAERLVAKNENRAINTRKNKFNSDSSGRKYVHLSNGLIQGYGICYTFTV